MNSHHAMTTVGMQILEGSGSFLSCWGMHRIAMSRRDSSDTSDQFDPQGSPALCTGRSNCKQLEKPWAHKRDGWHTCFLFAAHNNNQRNQPADHKQSVEESDNRRSMAM